MRSRIVATVVLVAAVGALLWATVGGGTTESATESVTTAAPTTSTAAADSAGDQPGDDTNNASQAAKNAEGADAEVAEAEVAEAEATPDTPPPTPEPEMEPPENYGPRMDLVEIDGWLNTDATSIDDFNGQVLLVEMWTFGCHNCKARIPFNQSYYEEFGGENFEILGVHAPEFSFERDVNNIVEAADRLGVVWPIALDTEKLNFRAWQPGSTNFWPRTYVIDQNGDIRYDHIGEGRYEELRETIRYLIDNPPAPNPAS